MYVFNADAFRPELTPEALFRYALGIEDIDPDLGDDLQAFAAMFAEIRLLPETPCKL
jgi:hypothetical protein